MIKVQGFRKCLFHKNLPAQKSFKIILIRKVVMTRSHNHKIWDTNWQQHINTSHFHLKVNTVRGSSLLLLYSYTPYNSLEKNTFLYFYERRKLTLNGEMSVQRYVIRAPQNEGSTYVEPQRNVPWIIHVVQMTAKETNRAVEWACKVRYGALLTIWRDRGLILVEATDFATK